MKLYYAEICVDCEFSTFVGIYTTYQKCYDALSGRSSYGDSTFIYEVEPDNETILRAWEMTNRDLYADKIVPIFVPAKDYHTKDFAYGKAEDYEPGDFTITAKIDEDGKQTGTNTTEEKK